LRADWQEGGFGLYLHWPFCAAKCPYCDFNSHVWAEIDHPRWCDAYVRELERAAVETGDRVLSSIYFGGGTPSLMPPETVDAILRTIGRLWPRANDIEITLEANPTSTEAGKFSGYADAGVNRVSLGVQSLRNEDLRALGRMHSVAEAKAAVALAKEHFERVSFDLIYARQRQTLEAWREELDEALELAGDHLSLYQLTIEQGTAFGDRYARGKLRDLPNDDVAADMYEVTQEMTSAAGFSAYEVSNHAQNGAESRHNLIYWRYGDYIGIGPGAHGRLQLQGEKWATETSLAPAKWLREAETGEAARRVVLSPQDRAAEYLMMGLRVAEGVDLKRLQSFGGPALNGAAVGSLAENGLITQENGLLSTTSTGRMVLNHVIRELLV